MPIQRAKKAIYHQKSRKTCFEKIRVSEGEHNQIRQLYVAENKNKNWETSADKFSFCLYILYYIQTDNVV